MDSNTPTSSSTTESPTSGSLCESEQTLGSKTKEWFLASLNNNMSQSSSFASRSYYNLDKADRRMSDLLIDQPSPIEQKRVWIGGKF